MPCTIDQKTSLFASKERNIPRAKRERIESLLDCVIILFEPSLGSEGIGIVSPDGRVPVNCVAGHTQNRTLWECLAENFETTFGCYTRQADARCRMKANRFIDDGFKICQAFGRFEGGRYVILVPQRRIKLELQLLLTARVRSEIICNRARGAVK